ncbi:MAG: hypothetical protein HY421_01575 [Candidatus Kerfeldbacteria bacterium]|nr:hypothetical protein [Candidatus Kerfeldbacteria bacterium]
MIQRNQLVLATILAGAIGLATLGIVRAQSSADGVDQPVVSTAVTTAESATPATTTTIPVMGKRHGHHLQEMADLLGLSLTDLQAKLDSGTPLYKIMTEKGWTYTKLMERRQADFEATLKDMVSVGYLTQEQADQFLVTFKERIASGEMMPMGFGHHGFGMGMGHLK